MPESEVSTICDMGTSGTDSRRVIVALSSAATLSRRFAILSIILLATNLLSSAQSIPSGTPPLGRQSVALSHKSTHHISPPPSFTRLKPQTLDAPYEPLTPRENLRWFTANTIDPSNLAVGFFEAAFGADPNRPREYGPHWGGFAERYRVSVTANATGNAIEAGTGLILREDPRYFRKPDQPFRGRIGNVVRLTFATRVGTNSFRPAYARYVSIFGSNFLSDAWRVSSEANTHDALLRSAEDFGGVLAANAFEEFLPDITKRLFHKRN